MRQTVRNNQGLTLIELIIVLSLVAVTLTLGFGLYSYAQNVYTTHEIRTIARQEALAVMLTIEERLVTAFQLEILSQMPETPDEEYTYIWFDGEKIQLRTHDSNQGVTIVVLNEESSLSGVFANTPADTEQVIEDLLSLRMTINEVQQTVEKLFFLRNMRNTSISGESEGQAIRFKTR